MSSDTQTQFTRIIRLFSYLSQHGATAQELSVLANCTERTVHRDISAIKLAGVEVVCEAGFYRIPVMPEIQKLYLGAVIFRKWYKVASKDKGRGNEYWYVVRADKKESKGTCVGPVGCKSWYTVAVEQAKQRNDEILQKREAAENKLTEMGWTNERIQLIKDKALADVRKEIGDGYKEEDP